MFQTSLQYEQITRYDEWYVTTLLVDEQPGARRRRPSSWPSGRIEAITGRAVILCTGGCGRVFPFTTNGNIKTGDGMALAYRAGAPLKDMEFVQYHPTGLPFTGILITEAARAEGGWLLNKDGYRYLQDYDLGTPVAHAGAAEHGARPPRPAVPGVRPRAGEGPHRRHAVRPGGVPGPAPPRREADRRASCRWCASCACSTSGSTRSTS